MLFNKLPGFSRSAAGLERQILARMPRIFLAGSLLAVTPALAVRLLPWLGLVAESARLETIADICSISLMFLLWTMGPTVAIAAFIVLVMKGPAYVADPYPLIDAEAPEA